MPQSYWCDEDADERNYEYAELADAVDCALDCVIYGAVVAGVAVTHGDVSQ